MGDDDMRWRVRENTNNFVNEIKGWAEGLDDGREPLGEPIDAPPPVVLDMPAPVDAIIPRLPPSGDITPPNESGVFFLMKREGPEWDVASDVMGVSDNRLECETHAKLHKARYPTYTFGVAKLVSVAAEVEEPIVTRRLDS
jgi:hypothetical protein